MEHTNNYPQLGVIFKSDGEAPHLPLRSLVKVNSVFSGTGALWFKPGADPHQAAIHLLPPPMGLQTEMGKR